MKRHLLNLAIVGLFLFSFVALTYAAYEDDTILPLFENNIPHIITPQAERQLETLLRDIMNRDSMTEIHLIAIQNRDIGGTGQQISFVEFRDNLLMTYGRDYLRKRLVYFIIVSVDENRIFVSVPNDAADRISQTMVDRIIQTEFMLPVTRAGVPLNTALFNMISHLGRYFSVATSITPRFDQSYVPEGVPYYDFDIYSIPQTVERQEIVQEETYFGDTSFNDVYIPPQPQGQQRRGSPIVTIMILLAVILLLGVGVAYFVKKKKSTELDLDDSDFEDDEESIA